MYTMVEIGKKDWPLLPKVDDPWKGELVPKSAAITLTKKGYHHGNYDPHIVPDAYSTKGLKK
jgi:hypothetical protein